MQSTNHTLHVSNQYKVSAMPNSLIATHKDNANRKAKKSFHIVKPNQIWEVLLFTVLQIFTQRETFVMD